MRTPDHFGDLLRMVNEELASKTEAAGGELETVHAQLTLSQGKLARLYDAIESGAVSIADLAPRIRERKEQVDELLVARAKLLTRRGGVPVIRVTAAEVEAQLAGFRDLLTSGSIGRRRAFLNAWIRRIEVHGIDLKIVCNFPWFPDGQAAADEPRGGDIVSLALERDDRKTRTTKAEPGSHRVLPMVSNGSPWWTKFELRSRC